MQKLIDFIFGGLAVVGMVILALILQFIPILLTVGMVILAISFFTW